GAGKFSDHPTRPLRRPDPPQERVARTCPCAGRARDRYPDITTFPHLFPISALMLGTALLLTGSGLLGTLIALRGSLEGYSDQMLGLMGSAYFVGFLVGTYLVPPLIRRMGHVRAFSFFAAAIAAFMLLHVLVLDP